DSAIETLRQSAHDLPEIPLRSWTMPPAAALQPAALEARTPQPRDHRRAAAHEIPDQASAVVLDHQHPRPPVNAELVGRPPPARRAVHAECPVERAPEPVWPMLAAQPHGRQAADGREDYLGCERQRGEHDPGGDGAVVRAERGAAGDVVEELPLDAI